MSEQRDETVREAQSTEQASASHEQALRSREQLLSLPGAPPKEEKLRRLPTPHAEKFRIALAALCGIAIGAIAIAVVVAAHSGSGNGTVGGKPWSAWAPDTSGKAGVQQIADYIAPFYRQSTSQQLDVITPISLTSETAAGTTTGTGLTVALNSGASSSASSSSLSLLTGSTVAYNVCGLGASDCQLAGTASTNRLLLLRREALELALYTFRYISSSQNVLVVLPPGHTVSTSKSTSGASKSASGASKSASGASKSASSASKSSSTASTAGKAVTVAVLFLRAELAPWLKVPLSETLAADPPALSELSLWSQSDEAGLVDQVTARGLFSSQIESQQEGGNLLVLTQLPPQ